MDSENKLLHLLTLTAVLARFPRTEHRVRHHPVKVSVVLGTLRVLPDSGNFEILNFTKSYIELCPVHWYFMLSSPEYINALAARELHT